MVSFSWEVLEHAVYLRLVEEETVYVAVAKLLSMFREAIWWCGFGLPIFYKHNELNDFLSWTFVKSYFGLSLMTYKERADSTIYW